MRRLGVRGVRRMLVAAVVVDAAYWALWFGDRSVVASASGRAYTDFEDAFPVADAWLAVACVLALRALSRRTADALLWLVAAGGGGLYLFSMDVLYDLEHGIYGRGGGGAIEAVVNLVTLTFSLTALRWAWTHRADLLEPNRSAVPDEERM